MLLRVGWGRLRVSGWAYILGNSSVRTTAYAAKSFSGRHGLTEKSRFLGDLRQPPGTLGPLLGDHLVTMGVRINPWGAM